MKIFKEIEKEIKEKYLLKDTDCHGWAHILETQSYAEMIAEQEFPEDKDEIRLAILFHDLGRKRDDKEDEHGKAGALLFEEYVKQESIDCDVKSISFAILHHCEWFAPDGSSDPLVKNYPSEMMEGINPHIAMCLWDADRLGLLRSSKIKEVPIHMLNTKTARAYANSEVHRKQYARIKEVVCMHEYTN